MARGNRRPGGWDRMASRRNRNLRRQRYLSYSAWYYRQIEKRKRKKLKKLSKQIKYNFKPLLIIIAIIILFTLILMIK